MKLKSILIVALSFLASLTAYAQTTDVVTLTVTGEGTTKEDATTAALRDAVSQAFGVFVSANTTILNDDIVKDEIATISSGNIQKYAELSSITMPDGTHSVTLSATVSINSLVNYTKSRGASAELAGNTFAMNAKLQNLNKKNEEEAIQHLCEQIAILCRDMYDYSIEAQEPVLASSQDGPQLWTIPLDISVWRNENTPNVFKPIVNTLRSLSLTREEIQDYVKKNIPVYKFQFQPIPSFLSGNRVNYWSEAITFTYYLRSGKSVGKLYDAIISHFNEPLFPIIETNTKREWNPQALDYATRFYVGNSTALTVTYDIRLQSTSGFGSRSGSSYDGLRKGIWRRQRDIIIGPIHEAIGLPTIDFCEMLMNKGEIDQTVQAKRRKAIKSLEDSRRAKFSNLTAQNQESWISTSPYYGALKACDSKLIMKYRVYIDVTLEELSTFTGFTVTKE